MLNLLLRWPLQIQKDWKWIIEKFFGIHPIFRTLSARSGNGRKDFSCYSRNTSISRRIQDRIMAKKTTPQAISAIYTKTLGMTIKKSNSTAWESLTVQTVYMPKGKIMPQYWGW